MRQHGGGVLFFLTLLTLLLVSTALPAQTPTTPEPEIVIRAVRGKCRVQLDQRLLSDRELAARSGEWAALGHPVRVVSPDGADYKCLAKIAFTLNKYGVRLIHFVDRDEAQIGADAADAATDPDAATPSQDPQP